MIVTDIKGNNLVVGDRVVYACKTRYTANGTLLELHITAINNIKGTVQMGRYRATKPHKQILKMGNE